MDLAELHRREYGRILASLIRLTKDIALAEDVLQEAFQAALVQWPSQETPPNPVAWLMRTARNKVIDEIRHRTLTEEKLAQMTLMLTSEEEMPEPADTLRLIFTCCHPAIAPEAQMALTLRTVCGLSTGEIARAFLVPVPTMAQRLVRVKTKIKLAGIPYEVPPDDELHSRLDAALGVIYLVFNEGYSASAGPGLVRADLCNEAIRLARDTMTLLPKERELKGLLALLLFTDARRSTRTDEAGDLLLLEDQDRSRWDRGAIKEGVVLLEQALTGGPPGRYVLQAAIAALHAQAASAEATDWAQIALLYEHLEAVCPTHVVRLNRAVAVAMADGYENGLEMMNRLDLSGYHLLPAARADLLRRLGRRNEAAEEYKKALALVSHDA